MMPGVTDTREGWRRRLRALRKRLGWTQAHLAAWMGVGTRTVVAWERGERRPAGSARTLLDVVEGVRVVPDRARIGR